MKADEVICSLNPVELAAARNTLQHQTDHSTCYRPKALTDKQVIVVERYHTSPARLDNTDCFTNRLLGIRTMMKDASRGHIVEGLVIEW